MLLLIVLSITFFIGIQWRSLFLAFAVAAVLVPISWLLLKDYQKERIMTFFRPGE